MNPVDKSPMEIEDFCAHDQISPLDRQLAVLASMSDIRLMVQRVYLFLFLSYCAMAVSLVCSILADTIRLASIVQTLIGLSLSIGLAVFADASRTSKDNQVRGWLLGLLCMFGANLVALLSLLFYTFS